MEMDVALGMCGNLAVANLRGVTMAMTFRHSAGFGRRMEYWLIGQMLREGLDVYVPLVDDFGIDAVIRKARPLRK
jgi:hypothetical protein